MIMVLHEAFCGIWHKDVAQGSLSHDNEFSTYELLIQGMSL